MQGGEGVTVRLCDRCDGVARAGSAGSISGFTFFLSREREIEQRTSRRGWGFLGVAGGGREQRVRREIAK